MLLALKNLTKIYLLQNQEVTTVSYLKKTGHETTEKKHKCIYYGNKQISQFVAYYVSRCLALSEPESL